MGRYCRIVKRLRGRGGKLDVGKPVYRPDESLYSLFADISILGYTRLS